MGIYLRYSCGEVYKVRNRINKFTLPFPCALTESNFSSKYRRAEKAEKKHESWMEGKETINFLQRKRLMGALQRNEGKKFPQEKNN